MIPPITSITQNVDHKNFKTVSLKLSLHQYVAHYLIIKSLIKSTPTMFERNRTCWQSVYGALINCTNADNLGATQLSTALRNVDGTEQTMEAIIIKHLKQIGQNYNIGSFRNPHATKRKICQRNPKTHKQLGPKDDIVLCPKPYRDLPQI